MSAEGSTITVGVRAGQPAGDLTIQFDDEHHIDLSWQEAVGLIVALGRIAMMPADLVPALRAELDELYEEIGDLPHSAACISATVSAVCDCPLGDVLDLIVDRVERVDARVREAE